MLSRKQKEKFMLEAIKEAKKVSAFNPSAEPCAVSGGSKRKKDAPEFGPGGSTEVPVGAVIVHEGHIIGRAHNQVEELRDATAHAEILAITQASSYLSHWRLKGCSIFVTLEPCLMCASAIKLSRISRVYFGAYDSKNGALISAYDFLFKSSKNFRVEGGILKDECRSILKEFFSNLRTL